MFNLWQSQDDQAGVRSHCGAVGRLHEELFRIQQRTAAYKEFLGIMDPVASQSTQSLLDQYLTRTYWNLGIVTILEDDHHLRAKWTQELRMLQRHDLADRLERMTKDDILQQTAAIGDELH